MKTYPVKPGDDQLNPVQNQWSDLDAQRNVCGTRMRMKKQPAAKFGLVSAAVLSVMGVLSMSFPALAGSKLLGSCSRLDVTPDGVLTALCDIRNGRRKASLRLMGIENQDGKLVDTRNSRKKSTFINSCRDIRIDDEKSIKATCTTRSGEQNATFVDLDPMNIFNENGTLVYRD